MEAKDTVMGPELQKVYEGNQLAGLEWQAEITWKAAIKEVVEFLLKRDCCYHLHGQLFRAFKITDDEWRAFLKKLGV